jgi:DNA polymerase-3 subunit delta'
MAWNRIRGHDAVLQNFRRALANGRFGQAYLFVGPEGVGKHLFARELAKALLCERPPEPLTACDRCPSCAQVEVGTHPDLFQARTPDDKNELPVAEMRTFCTKMALKPTRGSRKIGIVEDADDFNEESANTFLKTLEEPPPGSLLILIGTTPDRQLSTILSRTQLVRFAALRPDDLRAVLVDRGIKDEAQLDRLVKIAGGSAGAALAMNDEEFWNFRGRLVEGLMSPRPDFTGLGTAWKEFYEKGGKETAAQRPRVSLMVRLLAEALRNALRLAHGAATPDLSAAEEKRLRDFAQRLGPDRLSELIESCAEAESYVARNVQLILVIDLVLARFTRAAAQAA